MRTILLILLASSLPAQQINLSNPTQTRGTLQPNRGGTGTNLPPNNGILIGTGSYWTYPVIPTCASGETQKFDPATKTYSCVSTSLSSLVGTGLVKVTSGTPSIGVAGTDFVGGQADLSISGCVAFQVSGGTLTCHSSITYATSGGSNGLTITDYPIRLKASGLVTNFYMDNDSLRCLEGDEFGQRAACEIWSSRASNGARFWDLTDTGLRFGDPAGGGSGTQVGVYRFTSDGASADTLYAATSDGGALIKFKALSFKFGDGTQQTTAADVSSNTSSSVDGEISLFSSTSGKLIKRAAMTGVLTATAGVAGVVAGTATDCVHVDGTSGTCGAAGAGDVSSNTSVSIDSQLPLFSGAGGKTIKRATGTGLVVTTAGVVSNVTAPTGAVVGTTDIQTLTQKTLTLPTIGNFTNATHDHSNAANGGNIGASAFAVVTGTSNVAVFQNSPTILTPTIVNFTNAQHNHQNAAGGGILAEPAIGFTDVTTGDSATGQHGFLRKLDNNVAHYLNGQGGWTTPPGTGTVTSIATTSPITGGTITATGTIACPTCVTSAASLTASRIVLGGGAQAASVLGSLGTTTTLLHGNAAGDPTFGSVVNADIANSTIDLTAKVTGLLPTANMAAASLVRSCIIENDTQSATVITTAQVTGRCDVPAAAHLIEARIRADTGTPSMLLEKWHCSGFTSGTCTGYTKTDLLSATLPAATGGFNACARTATSQACIDGTTSDGTITIPTSVLAAGDIINVKSATITGSPTWVHIEAIYTID